MVARPEERVFFRREGRRSAGEGRALEGGLKRRDGGFAPADDLRGGLRGAVPPDLVGRAAPQRDAVDGGPLPPAAGEDESADEEARLGGGEGVEGEGREAVCTVGVLDRGGMCGEL